MSSSTDRRYRVILLPDLEIVDRGLTLEEAALWESTFSQVMSQANNQFSIAIQEEVATIPWRQEQAYQSMERMVS